MAIITTKALSALARKPGEWLHESISHGHGTLAFRGLAKGQIGIYFRYSDEGERKWHPLGRYDERGVKGLTLLQARQEAQKLAKHHADGVVAIREHVQADRRAKTATLRRATEGTFGQLLDGYVAALVADKKQSAADVSTIFAKWVKKPHPHLLAHRANEISGDDIMSILVGPARAGVGRTTNKLRSYLSAAFNRAVKAKGNPFLAASVGSGYALSANPVSATSRDARFDRALDRVLTETQLRRFLGALDDLPLMTASALKLTLMLGGQRPTQLLRVAPGDVDLEARTIRQLDPKGKRQQARVHTVPIPTAAVPVIETLLALNAERPYLFAIDGKVGRMRLDTLSKCVTEISQGRFTLRDLRRTCETMMAAMGTHKDIRAQIQSHGLSGVQARHYDKHDYLEQMSVALEAWCARLEDIAAGRKKAPNVVALRQPA